MQKIKIFLVDSEKFLKECLITLLMDKKDLTLLRLLHTDARTPISAIASSLKLTENAIRYRIQRLKSKGYLKGYSVKLSPSRFGKNVQVVFSINVKPDCLASSLKILTGFNEFTKVYRCSGAYSIVCVGFFNNNEDLEEFLNNKLLTQVPVTDWAEHIVLKRYKNDEFNVNMI